ncbi:hypothetical protein SAMN04515671_2803 [Nakamurella panacisegetis]|uniref:Phospho-glucose isomerase C-terminal SIS domain-containing protein n=1 Tax=Nakamurella panacisegetis TaxID=1090615 RepID=A0A1H0PJI7_9ACTN|nr:hypothetical protein [Nakamurella panacisegetis]SDP05174.1 hypothetical protein SAMN04515671_2803 [Nakamurella panacisegetis]
MSGPAGVGILRDPELAQADRAGLLPAVAAAGAQVRSVLAGVVGLPRMERPRAMVVVGADAVSDTGFLTALIGRTAPSPIVAARRLPPWVGALDVVVVLAAHPDDEEAAEAAGVARRRGATVIVRGAEHGPVAEAAGASLFAPAVAVPEALAAPARWSLLAVVASLAGLGPSVELTRTADLLDATALACHPGAETFLNPGVNLAEYLAEGTGLLIGCDPLADALAGHGARALADLGGVVAGVLTAAQAASSPALLRRIAGPKDLFADPIDDDERPQSVKPLLVSTSPEAGAGRHPDSVAERMALAAMIRAFTGAMHLDGSADSLPAVAGVPELDPERAAREPGSFVPAPAGQPADSFDAAVAACLRLDFAAVYVGIATGQLVPIDFPDGLGRSGGTRWAVRPATVGDRREREQDVNSWN